jgi:integrase
MRKSSRSKRQSKPAKPRPDFPLFPHATKRWAKKIKGKIHYFGSWADPQAALKKYLDTKDDLYAGRVPAADRAGLRVAELCNVFLHAKKLQEERGELSPRSWAEYKDAAEMITDAFGRDRLVEDLRPHDFERLMGQMPATWGPARRGKFVQLVKTIITHAWKQALIKAPISVGTVFKRPSAKTMRLTRAASGKKLFSREEVLALLDAAGPQVKAMLLLGVNAGLGNSDCAGMRLDHLQLDDGDGVGGWLTYPRPKTGVGRRCRLWPETAEALREVLRSRPEPRNKEQDGAIVFLTRTRVRWVRVKSEGADESRKVNVDDAIAKEFKKIMAKLSLNGHRGFYSLRHTFRTVADAAKDRSAVDHCMGHCDGSMASVYVEDIDDERLVAVSDHVRRWLFGIS